MSGFIDNPKTLRARATWERLIEAYADQYPPSHTESARIAGCSLSTARKAYFKGLKSPPLPPIQQVIGERRAENRAVIGAGDGEEPTLVTAQESARKVALQEGMMVATTRSAISTMVTEMAKLMDSVGPLVERLVKDIAAASEEGGSAEDRREAMRDVFFYQKKMTQLVGYSLDLERKLNAEPAAIIGVELSVDVNDLVRRARESSRALQKAAGLLDMPGPTTQH